MFSLTRPTAAAVEEQIAAAACLAATGAQFLSLREGLKPDRLPFLFVHDKSRSCIGRGAKAFDTAASAFERWAAFDLGWVRVANPLAPMVAGQIVAVEAHTLGLWSVCLSRIAEVERTPTSIGFLYVTTNHHVEEGEERFLLSLGRYTGDIWYEVEAVSRPRNPLAWLGYPISRAFQHRFARDSHRRMTAAAALPVSQTANLEA